MPLIPAQKQNDSRQQQHSSSPSPPPDPPIAVTPGPRATALLHIFENALSHTLRTNSYKNFSACFPTPAHNAPEVLESVWKQMNKVLEERAKAEWNEVLTSRDVVSRLNELDRLVGEAKLRKAEGNGEAAQPMHLLKPEELYLAHLAPSLQEMHTSLAKNIQNMNEENAKLAGNIKTQREEIEKLINGLETAVKDLEKAADALSEATENEDVKTEIVQADQLLKTTRQHS